MIYGRRFTTMKMRYGADDDWHLAIGGSDWAIGDMEMEIWTATSYECLIRGDTPRRWIGD